MGRIVLFDIDETILENGNYPANFLKIKHLIIKLKKYGYQFGLCTNRSNMVSINEIKEKYKLNDIVFSESGALFNGDALFDYKQYLFTDIYEKLKKNLEYSVYTSDIDSYDTRCIVINSNRKYSTKIKLIGLNDNDIENLFEILKKLFPIYKFIYDFKKQFIYVVHLDINKLSAIEKKYDCETVFITDNEENDIFNYQSHTLIYSVGDNATFNTKCNKILPKGSLGVEFFLREEVTKMKEYEKISDNCMIKWIEDFKITDQKYTQVSGYIFDDNDRLLIVKSENWTIPGGHPEKGETPLETLEREVMEEACSNLKDIKYLGAVEVVEDGDIYYQLRYTARLKEALPFKSEWEVSEREFVDLKELSNYIKWANGVTFAAQINSSKKVWGIK